MRLAQLGGYGFAYVADPASPPAGATPGATGEAGSRTISLTFQGESYGRAFNTALLAAGLQGKREGRVILAGPNALSKTFGPQLSKIYRLNQVGPNAAADYLANLGASVTKTNTITTSVTQGVAQGEAVSSSANSQTTQSSTITNVEAYGASSGPLLGLRATTDTRLGTITLVGDPTIVSVAEQYLKKLDLRQRQVALNVRILDVNLDNLSEIDNSFAFRWGNNFIVNDSGQLIGAFGRNLPPAENYFNRNSISAEQEPAEAAPFLRSTLNIQPESGEQIFLDQRRLSRLNRELARQAPGFEVVRGATGGTYSIQPVRGQAVPITEALQRRIERTLSKQLDTTVRTTNVETTIRRRPNPGSFYPEDQFFDFLITHNTPRP
jgi:type IV pilus assembly protein PilQ